MVHHHHRRRGQPRLFNPRLLNGESLLAESLIGICFLARPLVLDAARVKENCFSLSFIPAPSCQSLAEGVKRQVLPSFWRFCPIAKTAGGRQRPSGQAMREK